MDISGTQRAIDDDGNSNGGTDPAPGYSRTGTAWVRYPGTSSNYAYLGDHTVAPGVGSSASPTATATWTFANLTPGRYRVWTTWVASTGRATDAPYTVSDNGQLPRTVRINQRSDAGIPADSHWSSRPWWALGGRRTPST